MLSLGMICKEISKEQHEPCTFRLQAVQTVAITTALLPVNVEKHNYCRFLCKKTIGTCMRAQDSTSGLQTEERTVQCAHRVCVVRTQKTVSPCGEVTSTRYCCSEILISFDRSGKPLLNESSCAQIFGEGISKNSHRHITPVSI